MTILLSYVPSWKASLLKIMMPKYSPSPYGHPGGRLSVLLLGCGRGGGLNPLSNLEAKPCLSLLLKEAAYTPLSHSPITLPSVLCLL